MQHQRRALDLAAGARHAGLLDFIAAFAKDHDHHLSPAEQSGKLRADLEKAGFSEQLQRIEKSLTTKDVWGAEPGAAQEDVLSTWHQLVALHRQWHSLLRELKDAEMALGQDSNEANLGWLRDVKARLAEVDGLEALIEGFGESSGRFQRSV